MAKDREYIKMIHTARWRNTRMAVLAAHPLCQCCEANDIITPATEVHHIHPVEEAFGYDERVRRMFDMNNLEALCHDCHVRRHKEMGRSGKKANKERCRRQVNEIIKRFYGNETTKEGG